MDLRAFLGLLRRQWVLILACIVAGAAIGFATTDRTARYSATARLYVGSRFLQQNPTQLYAESAVAAVAGTYTQMIPSPAFTGPAVTATGAPRSAAQVSAETRASVVPGTTLIDVTVTDSSPAVAAALANAVSNTFVGSVQSVQFGPGGPGATPDEPAYVFQQAGRPGAPLPDGLSRRVVLGALFGLVAALLFCLLLDYFDPSVRDPASLERDLGLPVLAIVPSEPVPAGPIHRAHSGSPYAEAGEDSD